MAEQDSRDAVSQVSQNLSQVSPITAPSFPATEISSLNMGSIAPTPERLGYHALVATATSRAASPARSASSSAPSSTGSGNARLRAQRAMERARRLEQIAIQEEADEQALRDQGVIDDGASFQAWQFPSTTTAPQVLGPQQIDPAVQFQIDQAAEVLRMGQQEVQQAALRLQQQSQFQDGQMASAQAEFERIQQLQAAEAARIVQQELELRNQFEAQALARRTEIVDAQAQFHQAQLQLNIQRQQVEVREQEIRVRQEEIQRMRLEFTNSLNPKAGGLLGIGTTTVQQTTQHPPPKAAQPVWIPTIPQPSTAIPKVPNPLKAAFPPTALLNKAAAQFIPFATPQFPQNYPANPFHYIGEHPPPAGEGSYHTAAEQQNQAGVPGWDDWDEKWQPAPAAGRETSSSSRNPQRFREKELKLKAMSTAKNSLDWWLSSAGRIKASAARDDDSAQVWLAQVRNSSVSLEELAAPGTFYSVDCLISAAVDDIVTGLLKSEFQREELRLNALGRSLSGRVKLRLIMGQFDIPAEHSQDQAVRCISQVKLVNGFSGLKLFLDSWDEVVQQGAGTITEFQLRSNFRVQLRGIPELDLDCLLYDRLEATDPTRTYAALRRSVNLVLECKRQAAIELELVPGRRSAGGTATPAASLIQPVPKAATAKTGSAVPAVKALGKSRSSSIRTASVPRTPAEKATMPCFAFRDGKCTLGRDCPYSHGSPIPKVKQPAPAPKAKAYAAKPSRAGSTPRGNEEVCYDFQSSRGCTRSNCKFKHIAKAAVGAVIKG